MPTFSILGGSIEVDDRSPKFPSFRTYATTLYVGVRHRLDWFAYPDTILNMDDMRKSCQSCHYQGVSSIVIIKESLLFKNLMEVHSQNLVSLLRLRSRMGKLVSKQIVKYRK